MSFAVYVAKDSVVVVVPISVVLKFCGSEVLMFRRFAFRFSSGSVLVSQNFLQANPNPNPGNYRTSELQNYRTPCTLSWDDPRPRETILDAARRTLRRPDGPGYHHRNQCEIDREEGDAAISDVGSVTSGRTPARLPGSTSLWHATGPARARFVRRDDSPARHRTAET